MGRLLRARRRIRPERCELRSRAPESAGWVHEHLAERHIRDNPVRRRPRARRRSSTTERSVSRSTSRTPTRPSTTSATRSSTCWRSAEAPSLIAPARVATPDAGSRVQFTIDVDDVDATARRAPEAGRRPAQRAHGSAVGHPHRQLPGPGGHIWEFAHWPVRLRRSRRYRRSSSGRPSTRPRDPGCPARLGRQVGDPHLVALAAYWCRSWPCRRSRLRRPGTVTRRLPGSCRGRRAPTAGRAAVGDPCVLVGERTGLD